MDGGPYRTPQPGQGRVVSRPVAAAAPPQPVHQAVVEQRVQHHAPAAGHHAVKKPKTTKNQLILPIVAGSVILLALIGWLVWSKVKTPATAIDTNNYQAIFFTNGQVYFGKLQPFTNENMKLKDVYYLQTQTGADATSGELQKTATDQNNVQLIKLGDEIHGPQDEMIISKSQLLFFENLKPEGKVAKSIEQFKKSK